MLRDGAVVKGATVRGYLNTREADKGGCAVQKRYRSGTRTEQKRNISGTEAGRNRYKSGTKAVQKTLDRRAGWVNNGGT